jgi:hypothetical protein
MKFRINVKILYVLLFYLICEYFVYICNKGGELYRVFDLPILFFRVYIFYIVVRNFKIK